METIKIKEFLAARSGSGYGDGYGSGYGSGSGYGYGDGYGSGSGIKKYDGEDVHILCFSLFKTGSLAKSIFHAH